MKLSSSLTNLIKVTSALGIVGFTVFMLIKVGFELGTVFFALLLILFLTFRVLPLKSIQYDNSGLYISDLFSKEKFVRYTDIQSISKLYFFKHHYSVRLKKRRWWFHDIHFISPLRETAGSFGKGRPQSLRVLEEKIEIRY